MGISYNNVHPLLYEIMQLSELFNDVYVLDLRIETKLTE